MTDEAIRQAVSALLCALDFDTGAAAHSIDALAESYRQIRQCGGGLRVVYLTMSATGGHKLVSHSPEIGISRAVYRRKI